MICLGSFKFKMDKKSRRYEKPNEDQDQIAMSGETAGYSFDLQEDMSIGKKGDHHQGCNDPGFIPIPCYQK